MATRDRRPKLAPHGPEIPKITDQRLGSASVTRGNVGDSPPRGNKTPETGLTIGMLYLSPIGVSLVSKIVPARMISMTMGLWRDLVNFVGICGSARPIPW